jgi:hypothetical protein
VCLKIWHGKRVGEFNAGPGHPWEVVHEHPRRPSPARNTPCSMRFAMASTLEKPEAVTLSQQIEA